MKSSRRWSNIIKPALAVSSLVALAGCAKDAPQDTWQPAGPNAKMIDDLQRPIFYIAGIVGLIVFAAVAWAVFRFRDRGQAMPEQTHGKPALEITLTVIPVLILIGVGIPTVGTIFDLAKTDDTEMTINVTGNEVFGASGVGAGSLFEVLDRLATAIEGGNTAGIDTERANLSTAFDRVQAAASNIGTKQNALEALDTRAKNDKQTLTSRLSDVEDVDLIESIATRLHGDVRDVVREATRKGTRVETVSRQIAERFESLTPREREVLALVTQGKANKVMAGDLGVSQRTVEIHRARVMEKMGANSLAQLVRMMMNLERSRSP